MKKLDTNLDVMIKDLADYYKDKGLLIVGLNDSEGVNVTSTFYKKALLEYISCLLKTESLNPSVINAFSLLLNKTEHIDYILKNNLSLEEIKYLQVYSCVESVKKVMKDFHIPSFVGDLAYISKFLYGIKEGDDTIFVSSALKEAKEPTIIYSSGVNNLMREIGNNPARINSDYKKRNIKPNFDYSVGQAKKKESLNNVIDGIERNFENILAINDNTDIYTLNAFIPKSLRKPELAIFTDLIMDYNARLKQLCEDYNISYINIEAIGRQYNKGLLNFHLSTEGQQVLANSIIEAMYNRKIRDYISSRGLVYSDFKITTNGPKGMLEDIYKDQINSYKNEAFIPMNEEYLYKRAVQISDERDREAKVIKKVIDKTIRK